VLATKSLPSVADTSRIDIPTKAMFFRAPFLCNVTLSVPTSSQTTNSFLVNSIIDQLSSNLQNSVIIIRDSDMANNKYEQNQFKGDSNVQFILKDFKTIKD
jgi:hypothetical protein